MDALSRRLVRSALLGLLAWAALLLVPLGPDAALDEAARLVLLAPLGVVPLLLVAAVPFAFGEPAPRLLVAASWAMLPAALAASAAFALPQGTVAGVLVVPWGGVTALVAAWALGGAWARWRTDRLDAPEALVAVGLASLPGGAVWLLFARSGLDPGPYGDLVVLLTAAHFHYAAFAAAVWSGLLGRALADATPALRRAHAVLGAGLVVGFWLVAVGIALSRGPAGASVVETAGVLLLTSSAIALGGIGLVVASRLPDRWGSVMVAVSGGALALAMAFALWFNLAPRLGVDGPTIGTMLARHGWLNAVGFGLWGALGWRRLRPRPATP